MGIESLCYLLPGALFLNYYENTRQGYCRKRDFMKKKKAALFMAVWMGAAGITGCAGAQNQAQSSPAESREETAAEPEEHLSETAAENSEEALSEDQKAADQVAAMIDAIYVQKRTEDTDKQCEAAKEGWDALTEEQKLLVSGENADPDYFGRDTGDASADDPRNQDEIGEKEILAVSFGTSFNDSRTADIKGIEDALSEAYPDWSVRRAFTAQIIINHVQARDGEKIDNVEQALERAVKNGVRQLVVQPTHLMRGAEYDELMESVEAYQDQFESVTVAAPLLGEVGSDASVINEDKKAVAEAIAAEAASDAGYEDQEGAKADGAAFVFLGHGTSRQRFPTARCRHRCRLWDMTMCGLEL